MKKVGKQTFLLSNPVYIKETASIVGPKEQEGPLLNYFDKTLQDEFWGEKTWEKAESKFIKETINTLLLKSNLPSSDIDMCFAGDLLNQCIASSFGFRETQIPYIGLYGACSTFVESMIIASSFIDGDFIQNAICSASSHFCSAEKQFRFPLELGNQRPPSSQWTVTGCGASLLSKNGNSPFITSFTPGKIIDMGIKDANNMGAAMAGAAKDTLITHLKDLNRKPSYYDAIFTGDLGYIGKDILIDLCSMEGYNIKNNYNDCGVLIFNKETQDTHSGGSGCGCIATTFAGYIYNSLKKQTFKKVLLIATGALMNSTSSQQNESIPGIAHAISIEV